MIGIDFKTMKPKGRREYIAELVQSRELSVHELATRFDVTTSTIRRDLAQLADAGRVLRTLAGAAPLNQDVEDAFSTRQSQATAEKRLIAVAARQLVRDGMTVYLDAGTTCTALAEELLGCVGVTVVTPSMSVVRVLAGREGMEVDVLGGRFRSISQASYGSVGVQQLSGYLFDFVFTSADEVSIQHGLREESAAQIDTKAAAFVSAREVVVLADSAKIAQTPRAGLWIPLPSRATIISDAMAVPELRTRTDLNWQQA